MPETDVTKMKVADLKRELKLRGLPTTGNKTELQDRLQTSLIDGELSLEDTAISGEDLLDDGVLTDEDEAKIFGADENDLLQSPSTEPDLTLSSLKTETPTSTTIDDDLLISPQSSVTGSKKIVLKRKSSFTISTNNGAASSVTTAAGTSKENTAPSPTKTIKMSDRNPITIGNSKDTNKDDAADVAAKKVTQLSMQERLDMRAKKYGVKATTDAPTEAPASNNKIGGAPVVSDEKQIELLKKRAERFGCVVSSKIAKLDADEKLLKRQQRFGGVSKSDATSTTPTNDAYAEKARARLERFSGGQTTADASVTSSSVAVTAAGDSSN